MTNGYCFGILVLFCPFYILVFKLEITPFAELTLEPFMCSSMTIAFSIKKKISAPENRFKKVDISAQGHNLSLSAWCSFSFVTCVPIKVPIN